MFKSALGLQKSTTGSGQCFFVHKAIDFDRGIELLPIGASCGEDAPFEGVIYAVKFRNKVIPFVSKKQIRLGDIPLASFNKSKWNGTRHGGIQITKFQISYLGENLKSFYTGLRGTFMYSKDLWQGDFHGYEFSSDDEYQEILGYIRQAIPVLCFDDYSLPRPTPSICVSVELEGEDSGISIEDVTLSQLEECVNHLTSEVMGSKELHDFLAEIGDWVPLTLEQLSIRILDAQRAIFLYGASHLAKLEAPQPLINALNRSYFAHYANDFPSFEVFLIRVMSQFQERYFARVIQENYP